jgi:hypothetical protein
MSTYVETGSEDGPASGFNMTAPIRCSMHRWSFIESPRPLALGSMIMPVGRTTALTRTRMVAAELGR